MSFTFRSATLAGFGIFIDVRVLIVGCGYVGLAVGAELVRAGHEVSGIRRSSDTEPDLRAAGIEPLYVDITVAEALAKLSPTYDWVVNCVSSSKGEANDYRANYLQGMRNLIEWLKPSPPKKFVYTSSTGVYGQTDGSIVTEVSVTAPLSETSEILLMTEEALLEAHQLGNFPGIVLRLAGIYGPGRGYWFRQFLSGNAVIDGDGSRVLNMVHRDDVVGAIITALDRAEAGEIYNVVDDEPVTQIEFFQWLSKKVSRELPPVGTGERQKPGKRGNTNKRISNVKLKSKLGFQFEYPSFRDGYEEIINDQKTDRESKSE